jgi:methionyl-tRNA formyltransferase
MSSRLRIIFAGTPEFSIPSLEALHAAGHEIAAVYVQPDRPAGRGRTLGIGPVKRRALGLGLRVEQPRTLRSEEAVAVLASYAPDLMVVVAYGLILPQAVLDLPRLGCLNIHASLLPRWRGAAPIQRAILAGDTRSGVTIMQMDVGLDTGPMLLTREVAIPPGENAGGLHDRLAVLGAAAVVEAVAAWSEGRITPVAQPSEGVTYAAKIRKEEALIDWTSPAAGIARQVHAFNPWPVAETRWRGRQLRIWEAMPLTGPTVAPGSEPAHEWNAPGRVVEAGQGRLVVAAGEGFVDVRRLQLAGRTAMPAAEFLNANPLAGERLG